MLLLTHSGPGRDARRASEMRVRPNELGHGVRRVRAVRVGVREQEQRKAETEGGGFAFRSIVQSLPENAEMELAEPARRNPLPTPAVSPANSPRGPARGPAKVAL